MKTIVYIGNRLAKHQRTPTAADTFPELLEQIGFKVLVYSSKKNKGLRFLDMMYHSWKYHRQADFMIIDVYSTQNFWYAYFCGLLGKKLSIKYINILHGGNLENRLQPKFYSFFKDAYLNIAPSKFLYSKFSETGLQNLKFIPNAIALKEYHFKQRENFAPIFLWVRSFARIYNPLLAIKMIESLSSIFPDAQLYMVGPVKDDSFQENKDYVVSRKLPVHFMGKMTKNEWHKLSEKCDFFLNTTKIDNTPVSVIEAMALGLPILSSDVGGMPYLIETGRDGMLYESNNLNDLVEKATLLLNEPETSKRLAYRARKKAETFDWHKLKDEWLRIFA